MAFQCTVDVVLRCANIKASYLKERPSSIIPLKVLESDQLFFFKHQLLKLHTGGL